MSNMNQNTSLPAFLSNSVENERELLMNRGFKVTGTEMIIVNGKPLNILFSVGPNGELAEIVSLDR